MFLLYLFICNYAFTIVPEKSNTLEKTKFIVNKAKLKKIIFISAGIVASIILYNIVSDKKKI